jgi:hypothetical protein
MARDVRLKNVYDEVAAQKPLGPASGTTYHYRLNYDPRLRCGRAYLLTLKMTLL